MFYGWVVVTANLVVQILGAGLGGYVVGVYVPVLQAEFEVDRATIMLFVMVITLSAGLLSPFMGRGMDSKYAREVILASALVVALAMAVLSNVHGVWMGLLAVLLMGPSHQAAGGLSGPTLGRQVTAQFACRISLVCGWRGISTRERPVR